MKQIDLKAFAKINLTLDVCGILDNGFHEVSMILQQILLCDDVHVEWKENAVSHQGIKIMLSTNRYYLPVDERNLAYKAAMLMTEKYGHNMNGTITIYIRKRIPVAAGLAGGSSNGAAVIHALNRLWDLKLNLQELCETGAALGSDVPVCIMGQAAADESLKSFYANDPLACHCALATGTGTTLKPVTGLRSHLVLSKPAISVSTAEVYRGIDSEIIPERPDNKEMIAGLCSNNQKVIHKNMINVLENFTLKRYPVIVYTKNKMQQLCSCDGVLMSGSGPTVYGLCQDIRESKEICRRMLEDNKESFWTRTTW